MNIILFDGVCNLCNRMVLFITKRDRDEKFRFVSLQSDSGRSLLQEAGLSPDNIDTIVYLKNSEHFIRSTAALKILRELGGGWKLLYIFILIPAFIRDPVYNLIAHSRYTLFGKTTSCPIPPDEIKR